jgi:hypothetical protein
MPEPKDPNAAGAISMPEGIFSNGQLPGENSLWHSGAFSRLGVFRLGHMPSLNMTDET